MLSQCWPRFAPLLVVLVVVAACQDAERSDAPPRRPAQFSVTDAPGSWTTKASMLTPRSSLSSGVVNGILYAVGGIAASTAIVATNEAYDPATDTWTTKAPMPTARAGLAVGVVNVIVYAIGGENGMAAVEAYNPVTNTWTARAPLPTPRENLAVGVVNGILYALGGQGSGGVLATVEAYDPATNTWTTKAPMLIARSELAVGVVNGVLYAVGGGNAINNTQASVEAYNPATDTWTFKAPMSTARYGLAAGVSNGILYAVGGFSALTTVEAYDPATNAWATVTSMPTGRTELAVGAVNGVVYALGGWNTCNCTPVAPVEAYQPSAAWPNDPYLLGVQGWTKLTDQPWDNFVMPPIDIGQGPGAWSYYSNLGEGGATADLFNEGTGPLSAPGTLRFTFPAGMDTSGAETDRLWYDFPTPESQFYTGFWWKRASNWEGSGSKLFYVRWGDPANPNSFWFAADPGGFIPDCSHNSWFFFDNTGTGGPQGNGCYPPTIMSPPTPTWGVWHQIEFLFTMTTVKWWVDGNLLGSYNIPTATGGWLNFSHEPIWGDGISRTVTSYDYIDHTRITAHP